MIVHLAIIWRWPGARCVVRADVVDQWYGPMARPTDAEVVQAVLDYQAQNIEVMQERDREIDQKLMVALATAVHKRFKQFVPADTMTPAQFRASIKAEWDAL